MDRDEGIGILGGRGWLSSTPEAFRKAILSGCRWQRLDAGASIQIGSEEDGEMIGLADGVVEMRTTLGRPDTPVMHLAHPVLWMGYAPIVFNRPRSVAATAKTDVSLGRVSQASVRALLVERPDWWPHFYLPALIYGDIAINIAADLLIRDNERRCASVLLRLSGRRFKGDDDTTPVQVPLTQNELAGAANLSRNSLISMLRRLEARGLIISGYREITVRSPAALRNFVEAG